MAKQQKPQYFFNCKTLKEAEYEKKILSIRFHPDKNPGDKSCEDTMKEINSQFDEFERAWNIKQARKQPNLENPVINKFMVLVDFAKDIGQIGQKDGNLVLTIDMKKVSDSLGANLVAKLALEALMQKIKPLQ